MVFSSGDKAFPSVTERYGILPNFQRIALESWPHQTKQTHIPKTRYPLVLNVLVSALGAHKTLQLLIGDFPGGPIGKVKVES